MIYWVNFRRNSRFPLPRRATVHVTGDVDLSDVPALATLASDLACLTRVHVDLAGLEFAGVTFVSWLLDRQEALREVGGRLVVGRVPVGFSRLVRTLGFHGAFDDFGPDPARRDRHESRPRPRGRGRGLAERLAHASP